MEGTKSLTLVKLDYADHELCYCIYGIPLGTIHTILSHVYCHHSSLVKVVGYLAPSCTILNDDDTESYCRMCTTTLIASNKESAFASENVSNDQVQVMSIGHVISNAAEVSL